MPESPARAVQDWMRAAGQPVPGLSDVALKGGPVTVVNVWASWCGPCRQEHPVLMDLAKDPSIRVVGINYKDNPENARRFLGQLGKYVPGSVWPVLAQMELGAGYGLSRASVGEPSPDSMTEAISATSIETTARVRISVPKGSPSRSRFTARALSTITCDGLRRPFSAVG